MLSTTEGVLRGRHSMSGINMGFVKKDNVLYMYAQRRVGLSFFYSKCKVLEDGVSTAPLDPGI